MNKQSAAEKHGFDPYESGVLDEDLHETLVRDLDKLARDAGVPKQVICTTLTEFCDPQEIAWVASEPHINGQGNYGGLMYVGGFPGASIYIRMAGIAGCFLRNFVNARVMTVQEIMEDKESLDEAKAVTVLLIPDLFIGTDEAKPVAERVQRGIFGVISKRMASGLQTVVRVTDPRGLERAYGAPLCGILDAAYTTIKGDAIKQQQKDDEGGEK